MTAHASPRTPSAIDALGEAISHMRAKLFPFSFLGWLTLGFVSLLESCGAGGGGGSMQNRMNGSSGSHEDPTRVVEWIFGWIAAHMILFVTGLMVLMVLSLVFVWLRSRTIFIYIDDVATGRFDFFRPWNEHGAHADSFFVLSLIVQGVSLIVLVLVIGLGGFFLLWARANEWATGAIALAAIPVAFIFLLSLVVAAVLNMALRDFVAPLQISRNVGAREAGSLFLSMFSAAPGLWIGYVLLKFVVSIAVGLVILVVGCLTCCVGFFPLVNQTLFQPIYYAERAWSLKLLAQMGEDVTSKIMPAPPAPPQPEDPSEALTGPIDLSAIDWNTPPQS
ncbi:MAG: hypothetical protein ABI565_00905 [Vicinamibacteria bacterium]